MLLALDTSTGTASIALYAEHGVLGETTWRTRENHTRSLMPEIVRLLELCRVPVHDLRAVGVSTGPGSFTGLRIGLSAAKGLSFSLSAPLVGIPTLDVCARAFAQQPLPVWAVLEAGRGRFAAALYFHRQQMTRRVTDYVFGTAETVAAQLKTLMHDSFEGAGVETDAGIETISQVLVAGELTGSLIERLAAELGGRIVIAHAPANLRRAGFLAELAWQRWQLGQTDDLSTLAPFYIPTASLASG